MTAVTQILKSGEPMILARDLMTELTAVVNTLGGHKVVVGFSGDGAYCDKDLNYVNIPALPETDFIPVRVAQYIRGFAAHEAAHLAFTDPSIAITTRDGKQDPLQHTIWNCIEDYMIEKYWLALYPGAKKNFAATETYACEEYFKSLHKNPTIVHDLRAIGGVALTWMRAVVFGLGTPKSIDALNTLPPEHRQKVEHWFWTYVEPVETTQDCLEAAWIIYEEIMKDPLSNQAKNSPQLQQQMQGNCQNPGAGKGRGQKGQPGTGQPGANGTPQPGNGQPGNGQPGNGQPGNGAQPGMGQGNGQPGQGTTPGQPGNGPQAAGQGNQPGQGGTPQGQGNQPGPGGTQQGQTGQQANTGPIIPGATPPNTPGAATGTPTVDPNAKSATGWGPAPKPYPINFDLNAVLKTNNVKTSGNWRSVEVLSTTQSGPAQKELSKANGRKRSDDAVQAIRSTVSKTASELRRALKTHAKARMKTGRTDGVIDSRRLAHAVTGSLEYHRKTVPGLDVDTAVSILVDCSGSMGGDAIQMCQQLALVLENALTGTPVKHEILGYTTGDANAGSPADKLAIKAAKKMNKHHPIRGVSIYEFRKFGAPHAAALETLGNMCHIPMGGTPTAPAILMAHDRLARRKERRHVMFVLTDGESDDSAVTRAAVKAVEQCGVTVIGIGIGTAAVKREFAHWATIGSAVELPALMLSKLTNLILGEKSKKGMDVKEVQKKRHFTA